jgi:DNA (cytosine-5)-methyltransferase 1
VFVVAHLGEGSLAAKVLFESESVRRDTPPSRETRQGVATNVEECFGVNSEKGGLVAETLMASDYKGPGHNRDHNFIAKPVSVDLYNQALTGDVHCPLRTAGEHGAPAALVQEAIIFQTSELRLTGKITEQTVCPTLKANTKAGDTEPKVIAFEPGIATREGSESRFVKELSPTLRKEMGDNQVAVAVDTYNQALQEKAAPIRSAASDVCHTGGVINPADRMAVRRLTPRECERLQGFPDDHTMISWRNKPADQCPDGPRYKALGNSMAVPCMAWIGKRIDAVEKTK